MSIVFSMLYKYLCSGCHACYNVCPVNSIKMEPDDDGFLYPNIDEETCINCGKCKLVCPVLKDYIGHKKVQAFACINKDENIRLQSSSGGVFSLIAKYVLSQNGVVFGAAFDEDFGVKHIEILSEDELYKLRGSKYLQSTIGDTYKKAEEYLKQGKVVLFSGTPCQISGLKSYLGKKYDKLILQDIICHGVPSPFVWKKYIEFRETKSNLRAKTAYFRDKTYGWKKFSLKCIFDKDDEYVQTLDKDEFMQSFLKNLCLRPSCYNCHSKSLERESDITLADFWGIDNVLPEMNDDKGTSLVLVNSKKGNDIFQKISSDMIYKEVDIMEAIKYNSSSYKSVDYPKNRDKFMKLVKKMDFDKALNKSTKVSIIRIIINKLKIVIRRFLKNVQK